MKDKVRKWVINRPRLVKGFRLPALTKEFEITFDEAMEICASLLLEGVVKKQYIYKCPKCLNEHIAESLYEIPSNCNNCKDEIDILSDLIIEFIIVR